MSRPLGQPTSHADSSRQNSEFSFCRSSYQWDYQPTIVRLNAALQRRNIRTWLDLECMAGSTVSAMAAAVDNASAVVYGVSESYKCVKHPPSAAVHHRHTLVSKTMVPVLLALQGVHKLPHGAELVSSPALNIVT